MKGVVPGTPDAGLPSPDSCRNLIVKEYDWEVNKNYFINYQIAIYLS